MKISGFVGKPEIARGNRSFENYYINGRYVKNNIITKAIENAYKGFLMQHKFPFVSLRMEMEGNDLDVNVHPAKREVRFAREQEVYDAIYDTVRNALTRREMIPKVTLGPEEISRKEDVVKSSAVPEPFEQKRREQIYGAPISRPQPVRESPASYSTMHPAKTEGILSEKNPSPALTPSEENLFTGTLRKNQELDEAKKKVELEQQAKIAEAPSEKTAPATMTIPQAQETPAIAKSEELQIQELPVTEKSSDATKPVPSIESEAQTEQTSTETPSAPAEPSPAPQKEPAPKQLELFEEKLLAPESRNRIRMIGQVFDTYWLAEFDDNFYIIDQHAAHEKVYYERLVKKFRENSIDSQYLTPPLIVSLNMQEEEILNANKDYFEQFGFEIEHFGGREYCISAVPSNLYGLTEEELFLEMLDHLDSDNSKDALDIFASRLATMACKAAVKGNNRLSMEEAEKLLDELMTLENPYHCPHGRPTIISMTKTEMEKKFKRIV